MSIMPAPEIQTYLFEVKPFEVSKFAIGLRGAGNISVDQSVVDAIQALPDEGLLCLNVFCSKDSTKIDLTGEVLLNLHVDDVTLAE